MENSGFDMIADLRSSSHHDRTQARLGVEHDVWQCSICQLGSTLKLQTELGPNGIDLECRGGACLHPRLELDALNSTVY